MKVPAPYRVAFKAATLVCRRHQWLERDDVRQEAFLLVAKALANGKQIRTEYLVGTLYNRLVVSHARHQRLENDYARGKASIWAGVQGKNLLRHPKCELPGHDERRHGVCWTCKKARDARWRAGRKAAP